MVFDAREALSSSIGVSWFFSSHASAESTRGVLVTEVGLKLRWLAIVVLLGSELSILLVHTNLE